EGVRIWCAAVAHEFGKLKMDANHIGAQVAHRAKVPFDFGPLAIPIIVEQPPFFVMVIIESQRRERLAVCADEAALVRRRGYPGKLSRVNREGRPCQNKPSRKRCDAPHACASFHDKGTLSPTAGIKTLLKPAVRRAVASDSACSYSP